MPKLTAISLFSGAGGMDVGFERAGFSIQWANDFDSDSCKTYEKNFSNPILHAPIQDCLAVCGNYKGVDCVFGGPPCQGFSVAGKMDTSDERSGLVFSFMDVIGIVGPRLFVMENVRSLATLDKFKSVREGIISRARDLGFNCKLMILNSGDYSTPQSRNRMFLIGFKGERNASIEKYRNPGASVRESIAHLGPAGTDMNPLDCNTSITPAKNPVLRGSAYSGMLFNGSGRPVNPDKRSNTITASGGSRLPIIDECQLYHGEKGWVEWYYSYLIGGGKPISKEEIPRYLRRITSTEAKIIQTFPPSFEFYGSNSSVFRQIGNAVPCNLGEAVASYSRELLL